MGTASCRRSKAKASARSRRGVQAHPQDDMQEDDFSKDDSFTMTKGIAKKMKEQESRKELTWSLSKLFDVFHLFNPNIEVEGITKEGNKGLKHLKANNIDDDIRNAGFRPIEINKDQCVDMATIILEQVHETLSLEIDRHVRAGRHQEAQELAESMAKFGTWVKTPRKSIWEAIPHLREDMENREMQKRASKKRCTKKAQGPSL